MSQGSGRFTSFAQFYPYYLNEHSQPVCRELHYLGTTLTPVVAVLGVWLAPWLLLIPVAGYGFAWVAHFFIEKNRPATFTYPLWSLLGDYKMYFSWLSGRFARRLVAAGVAVSEHPAEFIRPPGLNFQTIIVC